jgi:hypothetical protein
VRELLDARRNVRAQLHAARQREPAVAPEPSDPAAELVADSADRSA